MTQTTSSTTDDLRASTDWFHDARWGVFTHYLTASDTSADDWNRQVDQFDVHALAGQLASTGTKYYFITIGQNSGHYCAPNAAYDDIVGIRTSKCARRDLIADLYGALTPRGIRLLVYLPSGAPAADPLALQRLEWEWGFEGSWPNSWNTARTGKRLASFQRKWEMVMREWSLRWGNKIGGWWIDGCYFADEMYRHADAPNFHSFTQALKAGNPHSIVAYNPGVLAPVISHSQYEDYTAGEISDAFPVCPGRWVNGAQYHILSYLGDWWGGGQPRFTPGFVRGYTEYVNSRGGVVTWDVPITVAGAIPQPFIDQLAGLSTNPHE
jgi:hypothetical protein